VVFGSAKIWQVGRGHKAYRRFYKRGGHIAPGEMSPWASEGAGVVN
jgi:hypothetical protein